MVEDPANGRWGEDAVLLGVDVPESAISETATSQGNGHYVVPAGLLNRHGPPITVDDWSE